MKGYQELVDANLVEKKRGRGMFVTEGASKLLLGSEREKFLQEEWPKIRARILRLDLDLNDLIEDVKQHSDVEDSKTEEE